MSPLSLFVIACILLGLAVGWWRRFSMALTLILVNFLIGLVTLVDLNMVIHELGGRPIYLSAQRWPRLYTIFTSMFLHAGFTHLWSNMLVLLLLSVPFEERIGRARLVGIYFFGGVVGFLAHSLWTVAQAPGDVFAASIPVVGASAAVFAVLGGYATLYPRDQVYFPFLLIIRMPVVVGAVLLMTLETVLLVGITGGSVSHSAHVGGAAGGVGAALLFGRRGVARPKASRFDHDRLERLTDDKGREYVARMRENADMPEFERAWFARLVPRLTCPTCGQALAEAGSGRLRCPQGHEESYAK